MSDTPKVGEGGWYWRSFSLEKDFPVKILEIATDEYGNYYYFVSYDSSALGRRSVVSKTRGELFKKPVKVVSYQFMSVDKLNYVGKSGSTRTKSVADQWCRSAHYHDKKLFVQRTEVTGDKIEVFVDKVL